MNYCFQYNSYDNFGNVFLGITPGCFIYSFCLLDLISLVW